MKLNAEVNKIIHGDCIKVMAELPDKSIDMILTDPPYNVGKQFGDKNEGKIFDRVFHKKWLKEVVRVAKPEGGGILMFWAGMSHLKDMVETFGEFKQILYWTKPFAMMVKNRRGWHCFTEVIFWKVLSPEFYFDVAHNGKDYFIDISCINLPNEHSHPTQKPLSLIKKLIMASSKENDIILDPFAGSGTTCVAAKQLNRRFIGIEIVEKYCKIAEERLKLIPEALF